MLFTKILGAFLLAKIASASPVLPRNTSLVKRVDSPANAGAYLDSPDDVVFSLVYGTVKMPDLSNAVDDSKVSYWIGIDGFNTNRVIQAGFDAVKNNEGLVAYLPFYEWFDDPQVYIDTAKMECSLGDEVSITISINVGGTGAVASFVNMNTQQSYDTPEFVSPDEDYDSMGINANWVIEKVPEGNPLSNFGTLVFTDCSAADRSGYQYYLDTAVALDLVDDTDNRLATGAIPSKTEVDITYVGT